MRDDPRQAQKEWEEEAIDEASEQSFPASDPPGWAPLRAGAPLRTGPVEHSAADSRPDISSTEQDAG